MLIGGAKEENGMKTGILFFLPLALTGCLFSPYREIVYYDLRPVQEQTAVQVDVSDFLNRAGVTSRFQYRSSDGRIQTDPDNKWIVPPEVLVARGLRDCFNGRNGKFLSVGKRIRVSGELVHFEVLTDRMVFLLGARVTLSGEGRETKVMDFLTEEKISSAKPEDVVNAAGNAVSKLAGQIKGAL